MRSVWLAFAITAGCFYDSNWSIEKQAQKHNAEAMAPAALTASAAVATTDTKPFALRVRATPAYVSQTVDWKHDTRELVKDANAILGPTLGVRLEIAALETWDAKANKDDLSLVMHELKVEDPGKDADWVLGLIGGLPSYQASFDQIGLGELFGKHLLMRSSVDVGEHDAIEGNLSQVPPEDRARLLRERKHHRSVTTLLHEIAHTLGAVHEDDKTVVMYPAYSAKVSGYGKVAPPLLRIGLGKRGDADKRGLFGEVLAYYKGNTASWVEQERTQLVANLEKALGPAQPPPAPPKPQADVSALAEKDRAVYEQAVAAQGKLDFAAAWKAGKPLWSTYPKVLAVQDLRCQLAMQLWSDVATLREECKELMAIQTSK